MVLYLLGILTGVVLAPLLWRLCQGMNDWILPTRNLKKYSVRKRQALAFDKKNKAKIAS